jgi:hypothetical protein
VIGHLQQKTKFPARAAVVSSTQSFTNIAGLGYYLPGRRP